MGSSKAAALEVVDQDEGIFRIDPRVLGRARRRDSPDARPGTGPSGALVATSTAADCDRCAARPTRSAATARRWCRDSPRARRRRGGRCRCRARARWSATTPSTSPERKPLLDLAAPQRQVAAPVAADDAGVARLVLRPAVLIGGQQHLGGQPALGRRRWWRSSSCRKRLASFDASPRYGARMPSSGFTTGGL